LNRVISALGMCAALVVVPTHASVNAELGVESRYFFEDALAGQDRHQSSLRLELDYYETGDGSVYSGKLFVRLDREDQERRSYDIREALWTYFGDRWEVKA